MIRTAAICCLCTLLFAPAASAQFEPIGPATDYLTARATARPDSVRPGELLNVVLDVTIAEPWKLYALESTMPPLEDGARPYGVTLSWGPLPDGISVLPDVSQSEPERGHDPNFNLDLSWFHRQARFGVSVDVDATVEPGRYDLAGDMRFQICNDDRGVCLPPTVIVVSTSFVVDPNCGSGAATSEAECAGDLEALLAEIETVDSGRLSENAETPYDASRAGGFLAFLLLAAGAGLASLLTPCVFPMIPLTVSYFTRHAEARSEAIRMAAVFGGAVVATFTGLGIVMAIVVGAAGAQTIAANPWVNLFIASVLVFFGLSLLGLFELRLPSGIVNYANRQSTERAGYAGVLFMGLTLSLVSFSCTAPFVGGLLAAAAGGTWAYPIVGMLVFSTMFALPFVLLALFPNALNSLPKSGSWMGVLTVTLGFIELAAAIKFLSNADLVWQWGLISRPLAIAFTVVIFAVAGMYLLGKLRLPHEDRVEEVGVGRMLGAIVFVATALYLLPGLFGAPLNSLDAFLPPRQATDVSLLASINRGSPGQDAEEAWIIDDIDAGFVAAADTDRPVLIDFTGYTCTNCRQMEANVFPRPPVRSRLERDFVLLRLYTDGLEKGPGFQRYQLGMTGTVALPTYAVLHPDGETVLARASGIMSVDAFVKFLDGARAAFDSRRASS